MLQIAKKWICIKCIFKHQVYIFMKILAVYSTILFIASFARNYFAQLQG